MYSNIVKNLHTFKTLLRDYLVKNASYSTEEFLSTGHNNVDTRTFVFNLYYYCVYIYMIFSL